MIDGLDVSRETYDKLRAFSDLVLRWTQKINLVSKGDREALWQRHIVDSVQVAQTVPAFSHWVDIGSGGGFPGIVIAILARDLSAEARVTLIESDQRKSAFLRTAIRELDVNATVLAKRIEDAPPQSADVLSARALADLERLLGLALPHMTPDAIAVFPKGANWKNEVVKAKETWNFRYEAITSQTNDQSIILKIEGVSRG